MTRNFSTIALLYYCLVVVSTYPTGAPSLACDDMIPAHEPTMATGHLPFHMTLSSTYYKPGSIITGSINPDAGHTIKGFLIQARADNGNGALTGEFRPSANKSKTVCGDNAKQSLTHTNNHTKTMVNFTWLAPTGKTKGDLLFRVTIVEVYTPGVVSIYWVNATTQIVKDCTNLSYTELYTAPEPCDILPTQTPPNIPFDPECGRTKGCSPDCRNDICTYLVTWTDKNDTVEFELSSSISVGTEDKYMAIGFSYDQQMPDTSVAECVTINRTFMARSSFNTEDYTNVLLKNETLGMTLLTSHDTDSVFYCKFQRIKYISNQAQYYDLNSNWTLLFATGRVVHGLKKKHKLKEISYQIVDFKTVDIVDSISHHDSTTTTSHNLSTPTTTEGPPSNVTWDPDCGVTKGCFPDCRTSVCSHLITWQDAGDSVRFVITSSISVGSNERWMAIGFSDNFKMPDTSVSECDYFGGNIQVKSSYNDGYENHLLSNDALGVRLLGSGVYGGTFMCSFSRLKSVAGEQKFFNISEQRILFFATGQMSGGVKQQHKYKEMSDGKVDFEKFGIPGSGEEDKTLIKIHACLMTVAWIFLSSVGVVVARHCKTAFPNSTIFKQKVWFQIHRTCMTLTFTCTAAAFVVIFVKVGGLSQISPSEGYEYTKYHPYLGIAVTSLTTLNPIMAFFRPHPGEKYRPMFNWAHWFVGISAHILAAITIFFGLNLEMAGVNYTANYMMVGYVGAFALVQLILEIYRRSRKNTAELGNLVSSQTYLLAKDKPSPNDTGSFQSCVTFVHAVMMLGIMLTLIAVIVES
ncbi:hypothetical protein CHS0354_025992 [Potamilus streckersoni]|uniref:Ferric-chelate reductase 1 n=1 Tax=Potamilus streckersoni TaxID=2493646 RepID=A0AAE0T3Z8_9BIVA|nr:hypothetical protein CHS0354_025992 [Potamilus streckersoni]